MEGEVMNVPYIACSGNNYRQGRTGKIAYIVMHYTGNNGDTAQANCNYFSKALNPKTSAHYFVDEHFIMQSVGDGNTAYHCGTSNGYKHPKCRNDNSIGIEMCSRSDAAGNYYLLHETVMNALSLVRDLMRQYSIPPENVIRHYDVTGKECPRPWVRDESLWNSFKTKLGEEEDMTQERFNELMDAYMNARAEEKTSGWAEEELQKAVDGGITDGTRPRAFATREEVAVMVQRAGEVK